MDRLKHLNPSGRGIGRGSFRGGGLGTAVVLLLAAAVLSSCASTPPDRIVYNTLATAVDGVQTAMGVFNSEYQAGRATEAQRTQILGAYKHFQDVARAATKVAKNAPDQSAVTVALDAAGELVKLIQTWTGRIK